METEKSTSATSGLNQHAIAEEISRLTKDVSDLKGPPPVGNPQPQSTLTKNIRPARELGEIGTHSWMLNTSRQLSAVTENLVQIAQGRQPLNRDSLLPLAQATLSAADGMLKTSAATRQRQEAAQPPVNGENTDMSTLTREEMDAKLELIQSRSDARVDKVLAELRGAVREQELHADARLSRFEERIDSSIQAMKEDRAEIKASIGNLKTTLMVTAISAVLAIVLGVAAFNATVLSNMVASFESGKNTAQALERAATDVRDAQKASTPSAQAPTTRP